MDQDKAKKALARMLDDLTPGTILHLLGDLFHDEAEQAKRADDDVLYRRCRNVEAAFFVFGVGIDSAYPK